MHLVYVDDSGDSKRGTMLTALIIEDVRWSRLLGHWLDGRQAIHRDFGVLKNKELHAVQLYKGRGNYCATPEQNQKFGTRLRADVGRIMLSHLAREPELSVVTLGTAERSTPKAYARFVAWIEDWAAEHDTTAMIFYDGQDGLATEGATREEAEQLWEAAVRNATPYRNAHRELELSTRRIVEDVMMQDSRYSQLIQAADLVAYGAFHRHTQDHPELWGTDRTVVPGAIRAYMRLAQHWPDASDRGIIWLD